MKNKDFIKPESCSTRFATIPTLTDRGKLSKKRNAFFFKCQRINATIYNSICQVRALLTDYITISAGGHTPTWSRVSAKHNSVIIASSAPVNFNG